jgi:L-rhamnose mutarotase
VSKPPSGQQYPQLHHLPARRHPVQLFRYHGDDFSRDLSAIAADPETQEWWKLTDSCQEPWPDSGAGGRWSDLTEIWHLGEGEPA